MHEPLDRNLHALPALVAVHSIVPPHDGRDFPDAELLKERPQLARVARRRARRSVAPVAEEVHVYVRHADFLRGLEQRVQVRVVRVDSAVRDLAPRSVGSSETKGGEGRGAYEAEQVQTPVGLLGVLEACKDRLVLVELPLLDRDVDPDDVLPHDAARADVQMSVCSIGQSGLDIGRGRDD